VVSRLPRKNPSAGIIGCGTPGTLLGWIHRLPSIGGDSPSWFAPHRRLQLSAYLDRLGGRLAPPSVARAFIVRSPLHMWVYSGIFFVVISKCSQYNQVFSIDGETSGCLPQITLVGPGAFAPCFELISTHNRLYEIGSIITTCSQK